MPKIAIIGAGFSGLTFANLLVGKADVTVFEKSRGGGGRLCTRRAEPYFFDHGAPFFTAKTQSFKGYLRHMIEAGVLRSWDAHFVQIDGQTSLRKSDSSAGSALYVGVPGMSAIAKYLAVNMDVKTNTKIVKIERQKTWRLWDENGAVYGEYDWVVSTAPAPQTAELFPQQFAEYGAFSFVNTLGCLGLLLGFPSRLDLDFDIAQITNADLALALVNSQKTERHGGTSLVVHSSEKFARDNLETNSDIILQHLLAEVERILVCDAEVAEYRVLHRWKYAGDPKQVNGRALIDPRICLGACGDWCFGGSVQDAFTSAHSLATAMHPFLGT
jgi:renalase